jgi:divalent metal cation (Fe/Co/Zn/Cd) transporter
MSLLEGVRRLINPQGPEGPYWNYGVLAVSAALGAYSFSVAYRQIRKQAPDKRLWEVIRTSKDPQNFSVLLVDAADLTGVALAFIGVQLGLLLGNGYPDAIATVFIGLVLAGIAVILANESRHLLVGESADAEVVNDIRKIAEADPAVERAPRPVTMHLGPDEVLLALDVRFRDGLSVDEARQAVERVEKAIQEKHREVKRIYLEVNVLDGRHAPSEPAKSARG